MKTRLGILSALVLLPGACSSAYYGTMEKLGVQANGDKLVRETESAITQADAFIAELQAE